jgi:hypothetical protein
VALRDRELAWEGCLNVRDLGGHATQDGRLCDEELTLARARLRR